MGWLNVLEAHKKLGIELPVNLKVCFEGMEENGSVNLDKFIESEKDKFFAGVDCMCISGTYIYMFLLFIRCCERARAKIVEYRQLLA